MTEEKPETITFRDDVEFLQKHTGVILLGDKTREGLLVVAPAWQGRVMTSTAGGPDGLSYGWLNRELISSGEILEHMNAFGGEDRLWLGPEGGQFSIFFKKGDPFDLDHWQVPAFMDTEPFETVMADQTRAVFQKKIQIKNYSDVTFDIELLREIRVLETPEIESMLGVAVPEAVKGVGYVSTNTLSNVGEAAWSKDTGLLSIWILGMFIPSPETTVVIPFVEGEEGDLGPIVNDTYFGKVPEDRLKVGEGFIFFSGDGQYRSKIGLTPQRAKPIMGSYDSGNRILTIVTYTKPQGILDYVNSMWELQEAPFSGDVVNSYNDGPPEPGAKSLGPFYELESSSPAAALKPGENKIHEHRTFHFEGTEAQLDGIARQCLGIGLEKIKSALK
ncbi:DUF6786 family protein [Acidobacteriota bacterium]